MKSARLWIWCIPLALYAAFWLWYTPLSGPMTETEIEQVVATFEERGTDARTVERIRTFFEEDDGGSFVMVNLLDLADNPPELPATGSGAESDALLGHYMEYMWPALFSRASHPIFAGQSVGDALDIVGIEGADQWSSAAMMRYRSRRDMWAISSHPSFGERHDYKLAALEKTIAFPVKTQVFFGDPRLILLLLIVAVLGVLDSFVLRGRAK